MVDSNNAGLAKDAPDVDMSRDIVVRAVDLSRYYEVGGGLMRAPAVVKALHQVSFELRAGKTLAVVGESGCGKSTLARAVTMIETPTSGTLEILGQDPATLSKSALADLRAGVQIVFQDPYGSLNPRQKISQILQEPLKINRPSLGAAERDRRSRDMLARVGLRPEHHGRYPHMFSGGQRQRIAVARALMLEPRVLVLDEPVSALDLSIQSQILNLLVDLQQEMNLAYLFISHDLSVVRHMADDVMVMYLGRALETGEAGEVFGQPEHPYTQALLSATPIADPGRQKTRIRLQGELPSPMNPPAGCTFNPRCWCSIDKCRQVEPMLQAVATASADHQVACHVPASSR